MSESASAQREIADTVIRHILLGYGQNETAFRWRSDGTQQVLQVSGRAGPVSLSFSDFEIEALAIDGTCIEHFINVVERAIAGIE